LVQHKGKKDNILKVASRKTETISKAKKLVCGCVLIAPMKAMWVEYLINSRENKCGQ
jgi:hypothetical protein